jgi:hypothetical protein
MNARWDSIEQVLWQAFDALVKDEHEATRAIFFSQTSHAARSTMLIKLAEWTLRNRPEELEKLKKVLKRVAARSGVRNALTHGEWGELVDVDNSRTELKRFPVTPNIFEGIEKGHAKADIERVSSEMKQTLDVLRAVVRPLAEKKQVQRIEAWKKTASPSELAAYEAMLARLDSEEDTL